MAEMTVPQAYGVASRACLLPLAYPWAQQTGASGGYWSAGRLSGAPALVAAARTGDVERLKSLLLAERTQFGMVVETDDRIVAMVDRVHGYPLFLKEQSGQAELAHDPTPWIDELGAAAFDEWQAHLYVLTGYCIGRNTLFRPVTRLLPGEFVILDKRSGVVERHRYYRFEPRFDGEDSSTGWHRRLGEALDAAVDRTIDQANGARIWLSLSAGYDSRVILGKLLERGYKDLATFSYGEAGNMEARVAHDLAESVNVPWRFVASQGEADIRDFWQGEGAHYMFSGACAQTTPVFNEFYPLRQLQRSGLLGQNELVVNGQSGDFITGGHIHPTAALDRDGLTHYTWRKHFALMEGESHKFGLAGVEALLADWRADYSSGRGSTGEHGAVSDYLAFEWQERQSRYVVNQHRAYDFLGLRWSTPLWDNDLVDLYDSVPFELQFKQKLYIDYLQSWNYRGLFGKMRLPYDPWPRMRPLFLGIGRAAGLFGDTAKQAAYRQMYYFSEHHHLYRLYGWRTFHGLWRELRSPASLVALDYLCRLRGMLGLPPGSEAERRFVALNRQRLEQAPLPKGAARQGRATGMPIR